MSSTGALKKVSKGNQSTSPRSYHIAFSFSIKNDHSMRTNLTSFQCHYVSYSKVQMNGYQKYFLFFISHPFENQTINYKLTVYLING